MSELVHIPVAFRHGTRLPVGIDDPVIVNRTIAAACTPDGDLLASNIVQAASDPSSPIHTAFEWDDAVAGERYREGQAFYLAGSLINSKTGERVYVSRYAETNNPADVGRIRINVRVLPPPPTPVERQPTQPVSFRVQPTPVLIDAPEQQVVEHTPEEDRSLVVFRRWIDAHKHEPVVLRAALRLLYDAL